MNDLAAGKQYTADLIKAVEAHPEVSAIQGVPEALHSLQEKQEDIQEASRYSVDKDAKVGHKSATTAFFGYKTHLAMTPERIITAAVVTSGEKGDGQFLKALVNQSRENGVIVESVTGDTAYSGKENLKLAKRYYFQLYSKLHPIISNGSRTHPRLGTSIKMPVCSFVLQVLWPRESHEPAKKIRVTIKVALTTLTQITVRYVRNSQDVIDRAPRQKLIA